MLRLRHLSKGSGKGFASALQKAACAACLLILFSAAGCASGTKRSVTLDFPPVEYGTKAPSK